MAAVFLWFFFALTSALLSTALTAIHFSYSFKFPLKAYVSLPIKGRESKDGGHPRILDIEFV